MRRTITFVALMAILAVAWSGQMVWGQIPQTISYQGVLADASGTPVPDGNYNLTLKLYDVATGGTALWSETQTVATRNGNFNVILGNVVALNLPFDRPYWLGMAVGSEAEMTPRIRLTSSAYGLNSRTIVDNAVSSAKIQDGTVADADVSATAAVAGTKINPNFGSQNIITTGKVGIGIALPNGILEASHDGTAHDLVVDTRGRVSIGDLQPVIGNSKLFVSSPDYEPGNFYIPNQNSSFNAITCQTAGTGNALYARALGTGNALMANHTGSSGLIAAFLSDYVSKVIIDKNGNVGIGTTSPAERLHVTGNAKCMDTLTVASTDYGNRNIAMTSYTTQKLRATNDFILEWGTVYPSSSIIFRESGYERFRIHTGGNVSIGYGSNPPNILTVQQNSTTDPIADAWTTYSSRRWKTNIQPITGALDKVQGLRGVYFDWKANGKHDIGLIAEEVGEVIPEVVAYEKNGNDASSVDYARLVAVLIEAVKEQQKELQQQKAMIESLTKQIASLEESSRKAE